MSNFNPSEHSVDDVDAYLNEADEAERERVLDAEAADKNRKALQNWQPAEQDAADAEAAGGDKGDKPAEQNNNGPSKWTGRFTCKKSWSSRTIAHDGVAIPRSAGKCP